MTNTNNLFKKIKAGNISFVCDTSVADLFAFAISDMDFSLFSKDEYFWLKDKFN